MDARIIVVLAAVFASPALSQDWTPMTGAQISATLTDQKLIYESAEQTFYASGRTLYDAGQDNWGNWAVRGEQYCSQWPPSDTWDCYDMTRAGEAVQFLDAYGNVTEGQLAE